LNEEEIEEFDNFIHIKQGYCYYSNNPEKFPIIYNLYIEKEYRRKGFARKLLELVIAEILSKGDTPIFIEADPQENSISKEELSKFYQSLGLTVFVGKGEKENESQDKL
jgi:GNAT superfamily N-acetyltransferase